MLNKVIRSVMFLLAFLIGFACATLVNYFVAGILQASPIIWGIVTGALSIFILASAYRLIRPDFKRIFESGPFFGKMSMMQYLFFLFYGVSAFLFLLSIAAFTTLLW